MVVLDQRERISMNLFIGLITLTAISYAVSCKYSFRYYKTFDEVCDHISGRWLAFGFVLQAITLSEKWILDGQAPFTSLGGILLALSFSLALALLAGRIKTPVPVLNSLFSPFIFFLSFLAFLAGTFSTPPPANPLMTTGLAWHIFFTFLGFSHFTMGFGVAVAFWIQEGQLKQRQIKSWSYRLPALEILDNLTVFYILLGFLFWMAGLGLGAVQAFQVWHRLPFDDPKILGSFLVLLIYGFFFCLRWVFQMRGRKSMTLVMAGYFLALFTFVGVRVFLTTQHVF